MGNRRAKFTRGNTNFRKRIFLTNNIVITTPWALKLTLSFIVHLNFEKNVKTKQAPKIALPRFASSRLV